MWCISFDVVSAVVTDVNPVENMMLQYRGVMQSTYTFVNERVLTVWFIVYCCPHSEMAELATSHLCGFARHVKTVTGAEMARWRPHVTCCQLVGSVTTVVLITKPTTVSFSVSN